MAEFWEFAMKWPLAVVVVVIAAAWAVTRPFRYAFLAYNRRLRSKNIAAHGWPPVYLDADGDTHHPPIAIDDP